MTRNLLLGDTWPYDLELECTACRLRRNIGAMALQGNGRNGVPTNDGNNANNNQTTPAPVAPANNKDEERPIREDSTPNIDDLMSGLVGQDLNTPNFELKPIMIQTLSNMGQFDGSPARDPRQHLKQFMEVCQPFQHNDVSEDKVKLKFFTFSLRDKFKSWLNSLPLDSVSSWEDLCHKFLLHFQPPKLTTKLRGEIITFIKASDEKNV
ncbi:hypothetical protein GQ457_15G015720 [Hibiscus cannabinus]